jgi:hypothetical protein
MTFRNLFAVLISVVACFLVVAFAAPSQDRCTDPEAQVLRALRAKEGMNGEHREKLRGLAALEEGEARCRAQMNLSDDQKQELVERKRRIYEKKLIELETRKKELADQDEPVQLGILPPDEPPLIKGMFDVANESNIWQGYVNSFLYKVYAGNDYNNPKQGMIVIEAESESDQHVGIERIRTPSATGPVEVVSEKGGVLVLESKAGTYEVSAERPPDSGYVEAPDGRLYVKTVGGETYYFDIAARKFQESPGQAKPSSAAGEPAQKQILSQ